MTVLIRPEGQTADDLKLSRRSLGALGGLLFSGYAVAALAKEASEKGKTIRERGLEKGLIPEEELRKLLYLEKMA